MVFPSDSEISRFMSFILRHAPEAGRLTLDGEGWTSFANVKAAVEQKFGVSEADILRVIYESPKKRFTLSGDRIRAAQGHSVEVDLALPARQPPDILFHGTSMHAWEIISREGLAPMRRTHVHLSADVTTARIVAARRKGQRVILKIDGKRMASEGYPFFISDNGVWLTAKVPPDYISVLTETGP